MAFALTGESLSSRAVGAVFSAALHLAVLSGLLHATETAVVPAHAASAEQVRIQNLRDAGEQLVSVGVGESGTTAWLACANGTYIGVGIVADPRTQRILIVGENTPASRAGLHDDDIVLNPEVWRDARSDGRLIGVEVLRERIKLRLMVRVGRVCMG